MSTNDQPQFDELIKAVEIHFQLPEDVFSGLLKEDDWSFVVKCHALLEATVNQALGGLVDPRLGPILSTLDISDDQRGKAAVLLKLDVIDRDTRTFIKKLSELRNTLVHDIRRVGFSFTDDIAQFDAKQRTAFSAQLSGYYAREYDEKERTRSRQESLERPKFGIWFGTVQIVSMLFHGALKQSVAATQADLNRAKAQAFDEIAALWGLDDDGGRVSG